VTEGVISRLYVTFFSNLLIFTNGNISCLLTIYSLKIIAILLKQKEIYLNVLPTHFINSRIYMYQLGVIYWYSSTLFFLFLVSFSFSFSWIEVKEIKIHKSLPFSLFSTCGHICACMAKLIHILNHVLLVMTRVRWCSVCYFYLLSFMMYTRTRTHLYMFIVFHSDRKRTESLN